jgi:5'-3' exonuclease
VRDEAAVEAKFGVKPESIPDYLAVLGDNADGFPGIIGWGERAAAQTLSRYPHLEEIPKDWRHWDTSISNARRLSQALFDSWEEALLFRTLATLRFDAPVFQNLDDICWAGPRPDFEKLCKGMGSPELSERAVTARKSAAYGEHAHVLHRR